METVSTTDQRRLTRSLADRRIGGVCAGVARFLDLDPVIVRILWVIAAFAGPGVPLYAVAWVVLPDEDGEQGLDDVKRFQRSLMDGDDRTAGWIVVAALIAGFFWFDGDLGVGDSLLPVVMIGGGLWLLLRDREPEREREVHGPPAPAAVAAAEDRPDGRDPLLVEAERLLDPTPDDLGIPPAPPPPTSPPQPRSPLLRWVFGLLVVALGVVILLGITVGLMPSVPEVFAGGLLLVGLALIVSAWFGRARGLIGVGLGLTAAMVATSILDVPFRGGVGERRVVPLTAEEAVADDHRMIAGELTLDLTDLEVEAGTTLEVDASVVAGQLTVIVDDDQRWVIDAAVRAGQITVEGSTSEEAGLDVDTVVEIDGRRSGAAVVVLDADVGAGEIVILDESEELR